MVRARAKKEQSIFSDPKNAIDDDQFDAEFWTKCRAEDLQEDLLDPESKLSQSKKARVEQLQAIQRSKNVLLNKKAAAVLGAKNLDINKELQEELKEVRDSGLRDLQGRKRPLHYASQLQVNRLRGRLERKDNFKDMSLGRSQSDFTFKKFLTSNPNWAHMKGQLDPVIKRKFIAFAKVEYKEHVAKLRNKMDCAK